MILLPVLAVVAVYARTTGHELLWDDPRLLGSLWPRPAGMSFVDVVFAPLVFSTNYFRPVGTASLLFEMEFAGGVRPALHHGVNVAIHAANTWLVGLLALRVTRRHALHAGAVAAGAAALYAVHPALVEGVAFTASRFDLLVTFFLLATLLSDASLRNATVRATAVGALFLLAALSKEMAVVLVAVLPLWHLATTPEATRPRDALRLHRATYAAVLASGFVYLALRASALPYLLPQPEPTQIAAGTGLSPVLLVGKSLGMYVSLVLWPFGRVAPVHHAVLPVSVGDVAAWATLVLLVVAAGLAVRNRARLSSPALMAAAALVAALPVANVRPLALGGGAIVAERFLLFPLALVVLAVAAVVARRGAPRVLLAAVALWLAAATFQTVDVVARWETRRTLWSWAVAKAPRSPLPLTNLSLAESDAGRPVEAEALARRALALDSEAPDAHAFLGLALFIQGRMPEARDAYIAALERTPRSPIVWASLGRTLLELGNVTEAEQVLLERALPLAPDLSVTHTHLSELYWRADRLDLAERHLQRALPDLTGSDLAWAETRLAEIRRRSPPR